MKRLWLMCLVLLTGCTESKLALTTPPSPVAPTVTHTIYKYSIVPGGVWTAEQAHLPKGRVETLKQDLRAYVNYRHNGRVYWTKHPVLIRAGEQVITDGVTLVRSRCGNHVSITAQVPTEPSNIEGALDDPEPMSERAVEFASTLDPVAPTDTTTGTTPGTSYAGGSCCGINGWFPPPLPVGGDPVHHIHDPRGPMKPMPRDPRTTVVPEPDTWALMVTGLLVIAFLFGLVKDTLNAPVNLNDEGEHSFGWHSAHGTHRVYYPDGTLSQPFSYKVACDYQAVFGGSVVSKDFKA